MCHDTYELGTYPTLTEQIYVVVRFFFHFFFFVFYRDFFFSFIFCLYINYFSGLDRKRVAFRLSENISWTFSIFQENILLWNNKYMYIVHQIHLNHFENPISLKKRKSKQSVLQNENFIHFILMLCVV